ncbi:MAG: 4Fe-4S dicluster domain-containing protein [Candidatus Korobacteraceae bacterium]|jgi:Fe-S-cluster-containing dehydrogenase component
MEKTIYLDIDLCVGCGACAVACMDQNDIYPEKGQTAFRRIYQVEEGQFPNASIMYVSAACMHCEDAPCVMGCPTGAITKDGTTGVVGVHRALCIGCHSCAMACPFGVPRYDSEEKMHKCNLCSGRVQAGLLPACVRVCPTSALSFESANRVQSGKEYRFAGNIVNAGHRAAVQK